MKGIRKINNWVERMVKYAASPGEWSKKRDFIRTSCRHGMTHFCDGRPNPGYVKAEDMKRKPPCRYFKNGKCTFEKILKKRENV